MEGGTDAVQDQGDSEILKRKSNKQAVNQMIQYIREGDIYIAKYDAAAGKWRAKKAPLDVFVALRKNNPSPFGGYLDCGTYQIISASPERFFTDAG